MGYIILYGNCHNVIPNSVMVTLYIITVTLTEMTNIIILLKGIFKLTSEHDNKIFFITLISVALIMNNNIIIVIMSFPTALFSYHYC